MKKLSPVGKVQTIVPEDLCRFFATDGTEEYEI